MPELEKQTAASDPLASLHKMSTTAGIVSADYVAISNLAIGSAVLGVATSLAVIWPILGYVAIGGVLVGVLALRFIRRSNGTLAGRSIAAAGIGLSISFAAAGGARAYYEDAKLRPDKQAVDARISELGAGLMNGNNTATYASFDPAWRNLVSFGGFQQEMLRMRNPESGIGKITRLDPNHRYSFYNAQGSRMCSTRAWVRCEKYPDEFPLQVSLRQQPDGQWLIVYFDLFRDVDPLKSNPQTPQPNAVQ